MTHDPITGMLFGLLVIALFAAAFFAPSIVASRRRHRQFGAIVALNILLGWTMVGWVIALVWSLTYVEPRRAAYAPTYD